VESRLAGSGHIVEGISPLPSDQIALADLRRPALIAKVEPGAGGVWIAHHRQPGVVRMAFGSRTSRTLLHKHAVRWAIPMNGPRFVFSSPEGQWRLAEATPGGSRRVTRLAVRPDVTIAWAASPSGAHLASIDEEGNVVVRSTTPVRKLVRARVPAPEITAFHAALCVRDDGGVSTLDAEGQVHRIEGGRVVATDAPALGCPDRATVEHWRRLLDGQLYAASSRVEWATLLRRTYGVDALRCPKCTSRMRVMATIIEPTSACRPSRCPGPGHEIRPGKRASTSTLHRKGGDGACTGRGAEVCPEGRIRS